ncbi:Rieske (2Fe-2S) protein [Mesorhizobium sp. CGMCC 1.15528]|uniref:Rieske (2Fe-2S) protein n=1 Tax=Mesorhizobium zhangyense TaxID=1776730 RepID=A0A7C9R8R9_9HYPH|nr:Rieske (2Fe-2S) protein [Mesorhizobium zhangyense]NGN42982.1 Rieske (2Fe-2S) protein [Mesorhizobium zhangyense]
MTIAQQQTMPEHRIGKLEDFPERKVVPVEAGGKTIGVLRRGDDVHAFANRCPHHGAPMCRAQVSGTMRPSEPNQFVYDLDGLIVKCPWHAYEFDVRSGEAMGGIIRGRLFVYHCEVRHGEVFVQLRRPATPSLKASPIPGE